MLLGLMLYIQDTDFFQKMKLFQNYVRKMALFSSDLTAKAMDLTGDKMKCKEHNEKS